MAITSIVEELRAEPYSLFWNNCIRKSFKFKRQCKKVGVNARVCICLGVVRAKPLNCWITIPTVHAWADINGKRIETAHPLSHVGGWGIVDSEVKPVVAVWL